MTTSELPPTQGGASPHDISTRLEEESYLQYTRQQYNTIQSKFLLAQIQQQLTQAQQQEAEDTQPPQDPEQRTLWRAQTLHGGLPVERVNRRLQADPDEQVLAQVNRVAEQRRIYDQFYERGKQHAAAKFHAGASLPDKLARATMLAGDDARLMYDEATAFSEGQQYVGPPGVSSAIFGMVRGLMPQRSEYAQPPVTTGGPGALSPQERRDLAFQAMQEGYGETVHQATGSRKVAIQALETIGSMIPYVAAAPALPGGIAGAAATGAGLGAIEKLSGEDMQAVDRERERGGDPGKMETQLRSLRAVQGAVSWGLMGLGAKAGVGNTVAGRLKQAAGMHMGTEAGAMAADATRGVHESITGRDPGAQSAILKAAHALSDPSLTEEQRRDALLEAGTHFGVGLATFAAVHVATGLKELAPRTMARPENAKVVADLEREARADLRKQDMEPGVVGQVLPSAEKAVVTIDTRPPETPTMKGKAELSGDLSAPMPPEPHITPPGPPPRLSKAEREAMGDVLAPGTKFKLHESVTIGGGGDLEVVRNEVGAKGVIQVKTEAGKTIDFTPDMLDLVLPESIREGSPQVIAVASPEKTGTIGPVSGAESDTQRERGDRHGVPQAAPAAEPTKEPTEAAPTQPAPAGEAERLSPGLVRGTITPTAEGTVPAFSRAGRRPEPTMEAPLHDAESPMAIRTKEGKRVPVDVKDPQGPIITASADLPDGTKVEAWGETLSEAAGKLEQQVGDKGTIEATTDLGRAVEAAQKEKAKAELREKMPRPKRRPEVSDLSRMVRAEGGIATSGADPEEIKVIPLAYRRKTGQPVDRLLEMAKARGLLPQEATESDLLQALLKSHKVQSVEAMEASQVEKEQGLRELAEKEGTKDPEEVPFDIPSVEPEDAAEAKRIAEREQFGPEAGVMLNPAEMIRRLIFGRGERAPRDPRSSLNRETDVLRDQERFNTLPSNALNRGLRQGLGGISERLGPHAHRIILKHVADKEAAMGSVKEWLYNKKAGILRGIRKGSDDAHDLFVAANKPHDAEGKVRQEEARARLEAKGMGPRIQEMQRGLEAARRLIARRGKEAEDMRSDIRDLRESIDDLRGKMGNPEWLSKVPAPLAKHIRQKTERSMIRWEADLAAKRKELADHIKNWGITEDYMHRVWRESMGDPAARRTHEELSRTMGPTAVGFRGLKHRVGKTGYIEDAVVSLGHYYSGLIRKVHYDRIIRDIDRLMVGEWRSVGKPYSNDKGEPVDPLSFIKVGQQYRHGGDTVRVRDVERSDSGDVTGVQVQVVGAHGDSEAHPAEWLLPDQARTLRSQRGGWKEQAELAINHYRGWSSSGGNPDFVKNWEKLKDEMLRGSQHLRVDSIVDHVEYVMNAGKNIFVQTLLRNPIVAALKTMPLNVYQNSANAIAKIGASNMMHGFRRGWRAMTNRASEEAWLVRDSGVVGRAASKMDLTQETGSLMPREGWRGVIDNTNAAYGYVYDKGNEFSGASIYLGAYYAMRPKGRAYQEGAPSHEEAKAYARGVVEQSLGVYDSLMAPQAVKTKWARLFMGMKGYTLRQVAQYGPQQFRAAMQKDATGNRDWRAMRRLMATASVMSAAVGVASQLIPRLWGSDTEGLSISNKMGTPVHELPWFQTAIRRVEDAVQEATGWRPTGLTRSLTIPFFQTNIVDKGPGPDFLEHVWEWIGADSERKRRAVEKALGKELHGAVPYAFREWADATANPDGSFTTYDAGSVFQALWPWAKRTGPVMDKAVSQTDTILRMIAGTPVRDILQRESATMKKRTEEETRGQHADTLDMILDYVDAQKQGRSTPEQMDAIRERIRQQGSMPDRGQLQRLAQLRSMGREGRLLFQGTKEARAQAIQDYALLKGHDPQMLRMAIGELFKERGGLSPETVEKVRALVK